MINRLLLHKYCFFPCLSGLFVKFTSLLIRVLILFCLLVFPLIGHSNDNIYGVVSAGFADSKFEQSASDGGSFKLGFGYQFHPQWYAELGFQQLSNQSFIDQLPMTLPEVNEYSYGMQGDAIFASLLGKASGRMGELFYRVGVLKADVKGQQIDSSGSCQIGVSREFSVESGEMFNLCEYDEASVAGVFGIGFDFYLGVNMMLRTEVEHISGENGLETNAGYVGLRYNF